MTVKELIEYLQTQPQDIHIIYGLYSEHCLLETKYIEILEACVARPDGWVQYKRPDMPTQTYLCFPGN